MSFGQSFSMPSIFLFASVCVVVINWLILSRDEFQSRISFWKESIRDQLRRGGAVTAVVMLVFYMAFRPLQWMILLGASIWILGLVLKAFSNEGKLMRNRPPYIPPGMNPQGNPQASPQPQPVYAARPVEKGFAGAMPRGPEPPSHYRRPGGWLNHVIVTAAVIVALGGAFFFVLANTREVRRTPRNFVMVNTGEDWNDEIDSVFDEQRAPYSSRRGRNRSSEVPAPQMTPKNGATQSQTQSQTPSVKDKIKSAPGKIRDSFKNKDPKKPETPTNPPKADSPAKVDPPQPVKKPEPPPKKAPPEPQPNKILANENVGDRLGELGEDKRISVYGESDSSSKLALSNAMKRVSEGLVYYLKVQHKELQLGEWQPKPKLINEIKLSAVTDTEKTKTGDKEVYVARVDLELTQSVVDKVYGQYLIERSPERALVLGQLYAGLVFVAGGAGLILRIGTSKMMPQSAAKLHA